MLVVDDNVINRLLLQKILQDQYEVIHAENGQDALDILTYEKREDISYSFGHRDANDGWL